LNQSSKKVEDFERGERLRDERRRLGMSQTKLAKIAYVSKGSQILYEKGRPPTADYLCAVGEIGVDIVFVLSGKRASRITPRSGASVRKLDGTVISNVEKVEDIKPSEVAFLNTEFVQIPKFTVSASAGNGAINDTEDTTGHYAFSRRWLDRRNLNPDSLAVITVTGDSMVPKLRANDLILLNRDETSVRNGRTYVVRIGDELVVKSIQREGGDQIKIGRASCRERV